MDTPAKRCTKCDQDFPATTEYFYRHKKSKDGLNWCCKECARLRSLKWHRENVDRNRENARRWAREHPEQNRQRANEWGRKNRERKYSNNRAYQVRNWVRYRENERTYKHRRRARVRMADGSHSGDELLAQLKRQHNRCHWCDKPLSGTWHADHVIPLSRGGSDDISNIVIACPHCNLSKHNKLPHEWRGNGGKLL